MENYYKLNNGNEIPVIGFGTYKSDKEKVEESVREAYNQGYRLFDTAAVYENEEQVGNALKNFPRESYFITSKLWVDRMGKSDSNIREALQTTLDNLQMDYLDFYLIHWPFNYRRSKDFEAINRHTWNQLIILMNEGKIKNIGVSNFTPKYLKVLMDTDVIPSVNQIEYHPGYLQPESVEYSQKNGIVVEAWAPLARDRIEEIPQIIKKIAKKYEKSISQVFIRFIIQNKIIPLPKATNLEHIKENINVFDFKLTDNEMEAIKNLPVLGFSGQEPDTFDNE